MRFVVCGSGEHRDVPETFYLVRRNWDDWFSFSTLFRLEYVDRRGDRRTVGETKIGRFGLLPSRAADAEEGERRPNPPEDFEKLGSEFFSLGQDPQYYETLESLGESLRDQVLSALRDVAYDLDILESAEDESVMGVSLLRDVPLPAVRDQYHRLAHGGARLTPYDLKYRLEYTKSSPVPSVTFEVVPNSTPPSNIHVLIGRNGVGKSTFLNNLARHLVKQSERGQKDKGSGKGKGDADPAIANVVSVSFSAFDSFEPLTVSRDRSKSLSYHYVGLKKRREKVDEPAGIKNLKALSAEMTTASRACFQGERRARWLKGLRLLEADPIFEAAGIADQVEQGTDVEDVLKHVQMVFKLLSSGHKIVLLTITKLVETVEEKSLVLLDEPEAHLHPPLLSALIRALSDLLVNRNGVAVIATHSPVVLQEVPRTCAWKIARYGEQTSIERPRIETFGENVGMLTNEVFGLEVTSTGFHGLLQQAASRHRSYDRALSQFDGALGTEARAILRAMCNAQSETSHVAS